MTDEETIIGNVIVEAGDKLFEYDGGMKLVTIDLKSETASAESQQNAHLTTIVKVRNAY